MPAGQTGGEAGVLALLADGERKLVVGHDNAGVGLLLVDEDAGDLGGRQGVGDVDGRIGIPQDDVDALAAKLAYDGTNTAALGPTQAPTGSRRSSSEWTATLERWPGSRAIDLIWTVPS